MAVQPPSKKHAVYATIPAALNILTRFFLVGADARPAVIACFAFCEVTLIACAIAQWTKFTEAYIAHEVERQMIQASSGTTPNSE